MVSNRPGSRPARVSREAQGRGAFSSSFGAGGPLEVRITRDPADIAAAQVLRYQVFYREMAAQPSAAMAAAGRDFDDYDAVCDHVLVLDRRRPAEDAVVATYRLMCRDMAERHHGFYSAGEYDLSVLFEGMARSAGLLEVGRSCVHPDYRRSLTIQRLWRGIAGYVLEHDIGYMFGCASLPGTDPAALALPLSYLYHRHLAPPELRVRALPERYVDMNLLPPEVLSSSDVAETLPPLIKGYLRLGAFAGDGAVVDTQFGTTDVFMLLPLERVADRYYNHFDRDEESVIP